MHKKHSDAGLAILGLPCNQFGGQEPGTNEEIEKFAQGKYGVEFDMFSKVKVNGSDAIPLYKFLKSHKNGSGFLTNAIKWNFTKFLINKDGVPFKRFGPKEAPDSFEKDVVGLL